MAQYKIPTQTDFNDFHKEARDYGEDGHLAVGNNFTQAEALELFKKYWIETDGEVPDWVNIDNVGLGDFGYGKHPDFTDEENEMSYILLMNDNGRKVRYSGWVLWA